MEALDRKSNRKLTIFENDDWAKEKLAGEQCRLEIFWHLALGF